MKTIFLAAGRALYVQGLLGLLCLTGPSTGMAQTGSYPDKPINIVVPAPPGGGTDFLARWIGSRLSEKYGQSVIVDNISGANGNIGSTRVARAPADGYTLLMSFVGTQSINPSLYKDAGYTPQADLRAVVQLASYPFLIAAPYDSPIQSVSDLIKAAKSGQGSFSFASAGVGSGGHLTGVIFSQLAGVRMNHIPYRGSSPAATDVAAGQVGALFDSMAAAAPFVAAKKLKALAITGHERLTDYPDVPTMVEAGLPAMDSLGWYGLFAPKKLPDELAQKLASDVSAIISSQAYKDNVAKIGYIASPPNDPEDFQRLVDAETEKYAQIIKKNHVIVGGN